MTTPRAAAQIAISTAGLTAATERNAMRLLARAAEENGSVILTWPAISELFGVTNVGVIRRHLSRIQDADIIHYNSNEWVYVTFRQWPPLTFDAPNRRVEITESARGDHRIGAQESPEVPEEPPPAATSDEPRAESARGDHRIGAWRSPNRRVEITESARGGDNRGEMFVCLFIDPTLPLFEILEKQTNKQRSAYEFLIDPEIAIAPLVAADLATGYELDDIQRQVCAWLRDLAAGRVTSPGALINRIRNGFSARAITDQDRQSELWRQYFPDDYGKNYIPAEYEHLIYH
ncbi:MAG: hypothetical protein Q7J84_14805 [Sulfuricaulis sp.]|nr:hypothetical protein [Sulfuricaulis sp.]